VNGVKGFFGIKSPSTVFAGIGENLGEGLGVGFEKAMEQVGEDMQNAIPTELDGPDFDIFGGVADSHGGTGAGAPVYIYTTVELDKKVVGNSITPIVSQNLAFAARGGKF
jgi:hypothetical protein